MHRNEVLARRSSTSQDIDHCRNNLREARRAMKRRLRQLERNWWQQIVDECTASAERGDMGTVYKTLRNLGTRDSKPKTGTTITADKFKNHFMKVSQDRYENDPGELGAAVGYYRHLRAFQQANDTLNQPPTKIEISESMEKVNGSAPGKCGVRMVYIRAACPRIKQDISNLVGQMFETRADRWDPAAKIGQIVPLFKKGDKNDTNSKRGVCLLAMCSRILARMIAKRLRRRREKMNLLDKYQSGFRPNRSTAGETQIIIKSKKIPVTS